MSSAPLTFSFSRILRNGQYDVQKVIKNESVDSDPMSPQLTNLRLRRRHINAGSPVVFDAEPGEAELEPLQPLAGRVQLVGAGVEVQQEGRAQRRCQEP